jgi:predicted nucleotidyltransferase
LSRYQVMSPKDKILITIQKNADQLKTYRVKQVGLFGSYVHGRERAKSDIDILVEFQRGGKTFDNYMGVKFFLEKTFHRKVDLVIKDSLKPRIKDRVLSEVSYA